MKKSVLFTTLGLAAAVGAQAQAQETGRVISSTPVIQQVAVPRQSCNNQPVVVQRSGPGAGAAIGAIAGGLLGNTIGHGGGRAAATVLGVLGGAVVGDNVQGNNGYVQNVPQCTTQTYYENRTVAYNVTYEYAGREYTVQMPRDPGATIPLQVSPVGAGPAQAPEYAAAPPQTYYGGGVPIVREVNVGPNTIYSGPAYPMDNQAYPQAGYAYPQAGYAYPAPMVVPGPTVYPAYGYRPYYPPVGISLNLGYSRGYGHRGHRGHWR